LEPAADLYLTLLKGCLTRSLFLDEQEALLGGRRGKLWNTFRRYTKSELRIVLPITSRPTAVARRLEGRFKPRNGETMIGQKRLDNIQECVTQVIADGVPGDLIETGVWRGGGTILMRAVLAAHGVGDRRVWVADSFEGLPASDAQRDPGGDKLDIRGALAVSLEDVRANFAKYGLLDDSVQFLVGWFSDTLPTAPIEQLAVVRLDGDLYGSTMDAMSALYPKLSIGGYLIVDDYNDPVWSKGCGEAIRDYRCEHGISEPMVEVDWTGVYWRRER